MTSTYTSNKNIEKPANGDYPDTWNVPVNNDWDIIDKALGSAVTKTLSNVDVFLTISEAQNQQIVLTGSLTGNVNVVIPYKYLSSTEAVGGTWVVYNNTTGSYTVTILTEVSGSAGVAIPQGKRALVYSNGTDVNFADDTRLTQGTGISISGQTVSLDVPVTVARGGTGATSLTANNVILGNGTSSVQFVAPGTSGNVLTSNGTTWISSAPTGGGGGTGTVTSVGLSAGTTGLTISSSTSNPITSSGTFTLSGTLSVPNGGTGATTLTGYVKGSGSGALTASSTIPAGDITGSFSSISVTGGTIGGSTTVNTTGDGKFGQVKATTGTGSGTGYVFTTGGGSFATNSNDSFLNFTTNTSIYSSGSGSTVTCALNGTTAWYINSSLFEISSTNAAKPGGGSWIASSDVRVKKNVQDYTLSADQLLTLRPVSYQYNGLYGTPSNGQTYIGLIAQEVAETPFSSMVGTYNYNGTTLLNLDSSQLVYALINAVQDLTARVKALEAKV